MVQKRPPQSYIASIMRGRQLLHSLSKMKNRWESIKKRNFCRFPVKPGRLGLRLWAIHSISYLGANIIFDFSFYFFFSFRIWALTVNKVHLFFLFSVSVCVCLCDKGCQAQKMARRTQFSVSPGWWPEIYYTTTLGWALGSQQPSLGPKHLKRAKVRGGGGVKRTVR